MKKVIVHFDIPKGTQKQYDQIWEDLRSAGYENPKGLIFHVGGPKPNGGWMVTDVWDSENDFQQFSKILMPIIQRNNLQEAKPEIMPAHYVFQHVFQHLKEDVLS